MYFLKTSYLTDYFNHRSSVKVILSADSILLQSKKNDAIFYSYYDWSLRSDFKCFNNAK